MAERRMFAMTIVDSDAFLDMTLGAQALYFHLCMRADDDGFLNNPKKIQRIAGANNEDLKQLINKRFLITFPSGVVVIKHWKIHNYIKKDRYKATVYTIEMQQLSTKKNGSYTESIHAGSTLEPDCIQNGSGLDSQVRVRLELGKSKDSIKENISSELSKYESVEAADSKKNNNHEQLKDQPDKPVFCTIITNTKKEYPITDELVEMWEQTYPAVNVRQELMEMKAWSIANQTKRKTKNGMLGFVNKWLSKEQDNASRFPGKEKKTDAELLEEFKERYKDL